MIACRSTYAPHRRVGSAVGASPLHCLGLLQPVFVATASPASTVRGVDSISVSAPRLRAPINAACVNNSDTSYRRTCASGFSGPFCQTRDVVVVVDSLCRSSPCQNGATCVDLDAKYQLYLSVSGTVCRPTVRYAAREFDIVAVCRSAVCRQRMRGNGVQTATVFRCHGIPVQLHGHRIRRPSVPDGRRRMFSKLVVFRCCCCPCKHGGVCINSPGSFFCNCTGTGFAGTYCYDDIDECVAVPAKTSTSPCMSGGLLGCDYKPKIYRGLMHVSLEQQVELCICQAKYQQPCSAKICNIIPLRANSVENLK